MRPPSYEHLSLFVACQALSSLSFASKDRIRVIENIRVVSTYHLLIRLELFEFVIELGDLCLCVLAPFILSLASIFHTLNFKLMLSILLHQLLFFLHILCQQLFSVSERIFKFCNFDRSYIAEHLLVFDWNCVSLVIKMDVDGLGHSVGVSSQWMHHLIRLSSLLLVLVDVLRERNITAVCSMIALAVYRLAVLARVMLLA